MGAVDARNTWSRVLIITGGIAMIVGAIDPLEGSVVILVGSVLVLLGVALGVHERRVLTYWGAAVALIALGVATMFALSTAGGFGGDTGRSMWWALAITPYPVGWLMGIVDLLARLIRGVRQRHAAM